MAALPQAIEFDQTPNKLLYQIAEDERERQRQMELLRMKDEQARLEAFGGAQKSIIDATKNIPYQAQQSILANGYNQLKELFKNKNISTSEVTYRAADIVNTAVSTGNAYNSYLQKGKEYVNNLKDLGWRETELHAAVSNGIFKTVPVRDASGKVTYMRDLKTPEELGDPNELLQSELKSHPHLYWNRAKFAETFEKYTSGYKPAFDKKSTTTDPTGRIVSTSKFNLEKFPWTKEVYEKDPLTGQEIGYSVLDTEDVEIPLSSQELSKLKSMDSGKLTNEQREMATTGKKKYQVLSTQAMDRLAAGLPDLATDAVVGGMDLLDDENKRRGFNPALITEQNVNQFVEMGAVNPYDEGNRRIYSSLYLTNHPSMQKFKMRRDVDVSKKTDNPPRVSINMMNQTPNDEKPVHVKDRLTQIGKLNPEFYDKNWKNKSGEQFYDVTSQFSFNIIKDAGTSKPPAKVLYTTGTKANPKPHYMVYEFEGDKPQIKSELDMENWLIPAIQDMGYGDKNFRRFNDQPSSSIADMLRKNKKK